MLFSDFPQPLLYEYGNNSLAPIGFALNIEVVNNQSTKTKVTEYYADVETAEGRWHRVLSLPMSPAHTIYFLNQRKMELGMRCNFEPGVFDNIAENRTLDAGQPLQGWMFFEWPLALRGTTVSPKKVRITVKNAQGESTESILDENRTPEPGASSFDNGGVFCSGLPGEKIDLTGRNIRPLRD